MNTDKSRRCIGCRFFGLGKDGVAGTCRKHAPRFRPNDSSTQGAWPITYRHDWCGEYEPELTKPDDDGGNGKGSTARS